MDVVHITPRFLPQIDGLGDYARLMAEHLHASFGMESRFIVGDPGWNRLAKPAAGPFAVEGVGERNVDDLLARLGTSETVVLHYVPYAYHQRGVPFWINRALRRWKEADRRRRLIVVVHEVWASGPPWKSEFYLSLVQRWLVTELHRLCDGALTSTALMQRMLDQIAPGKTRLMPIPSAFPPMETLQDRAFHRGGPIRVVAFGQEASRQLSVTVHEKLLRTLHGEGLLRNVSVVGKGAEGGANPSADIRFLRTFLPAESIEAHPDVTPRRGAELLQTSDLFLSYYPSNLACKSSALTAALAAGCVPVLPEARAAEPLKEGTHVLACNGSAQETQQIVALARAGEVGAMGEAGWRWYQQEASWSAVAKEIAQLIGKRS